MTRNPSSPKAFGAGNGSLKAQGEHGFGYDPHFYLPDHACTAAQLAPEIKNQISHRAQALRILLDKIEAA